ncbi:MAG: hypothetical protein AB8I08_39095 [Sandaracinaceae bacterium]
MTYRLGTALAVFALLIPGGCQSGPSTEGELGVASMSYADSHRSCDQNCSLEVPLAVGARAWVFVEVPWERGAYTVRAADPEVVSFGASRSADHHQLRGLAPGDTMLELVDERDELIDRFSIQVRPIARLTGVPDGTVRLGARERGYDLKAYDALERPLRGLQAIDVEAPDFVDVTLPAYGTTLENVNTPGRLGAAQLPEVLVLRTDQSEQSGTVTITSSERSWSFEVFAAAPEVASIVLSVEPEDENATVTAEFTVENTRDRVIPCCRWSLVTEDADAGLNGETCATVGVFNADLDRPQEVEVLCESGGAEARATVSLSAGS